MKALAESKEKDRKTMKRYVRLLAAMIVLSRKMRGLACLSTLHDHLRKVAHDTGGNFEPVMFAIKQKFDEL